MMTADEAKALKPDIILLDVIIKGYNITGDEICKEIKSREDYIKILLVSGEENLHDLANKCSADGYLPKPFDIKSLKVLIADGAD
ncbi:response regulator [Taibaiella lutea]|uniref:response regulator n=1 Tax=Taibaiella lutea TaxID=2608001 RepID=UPI001C103913|nr:response regulator [Taibaiella lutea]